MVTESAHDANGESLFARYCTLLEEEAERQETVLAVCRAQGEAARARDVAALEAHTAALTASIQATAQAETARAAASEAIARWAGMPGARVTLREAVGIAPEPWAARLEYCRTRLRHAVETSRAVTRGNALVLRTSLRIASRALQILIQCRVPEGPAYDALGIEHGSRTLEPALLDRRG